ncbi:MAG TPA: acyltransferase [Alphaproteobacteria bacterium]|nr:acyltransferase [Alphaproteobacteria bacterium]HAJ45085.1 acyltransferase [Alphaproteobacteria bacterium]
MRKDHRPYWMWASMSGAARAYARHFVVPQFDSVGEGTLFTRPWGIEAIGPNMRLGRHVHINAAPGLNTKLCVWNAGERWGRLDIGDYVLISPGTQIISSISIEIGANTMIASQVYISDSDWHGTYDRLREAGQARPMVIGPNVWIGVKAIIGKGVHIGENSIIGAGSVVTRDVPANVIAAGNPAEVRRDLDPNGPYHRRAELFGEPDKLARFTEAVRREQLKANSTWGWLRSKIWPSVED